MHFCKRSGCFSGVVDDVIDFRCHQRMLTSGKYDDVTILQMTGNESWNVVSHVVSYEVSYTNEISEIVPPPHVE